MRWSAPASSASRSWCTKACTGACSSTPRSTTGSRSGSAPIPSGVSCRAYRRRHHLHHRHTLDDDDPDLRCPRHSPCRVPACGVRVAARSRRHHGVLARARLAGLARRIRRAVAPAARPARGQRGPVRRAHRTRPLAALPAPVGAAAGHLVSAGLARARHGRARDGGGRRRSAAQHAHDPRGAGRARVPGAVLGELPPGTSSLRVRAVLAPACVHALLLAKGHGARMEIASGYLEVLRRVSSAR